MFNRESMTSKILVIRIHPCLPRKCNPDSMLDFKTL